MLAVNYITISNNLKEYCDKATDENETVIFKADNDKSAVLISLESYNHIMKYALDAGYCANSEKSNKNKPKSIEELFEGYDGDYAPTEFDWGEPVGSEVW